MPEYDDHDKEVGCGAQPGQHLDRDVDEYDDHDDFDDNNDDSDDEYDEYDDFHE